MVGVEILATEKIVSETAFDWTGFWISVIGLGIFFILVAILEICSGEIGMAAFTIILGTFITLVFGFLMGDANSQPIAYKNQYKVTISDEVKMNEFYERYKVIDQEGKIYTVEERDD
jgi:hypothetical protein